MTSLRYFQPQYMSLLRPHPLWTTSKSNSYEVNKSVVVARMLSGRYRSDWLTRHWSPTNKDGFCLLCPLSNTPGDIEHLLVNCEALSTKRDHLFQFFDRQTQNSPPLRSLLNNMRESSTEAFVQFLLDPSVVPLVIHDVQKKLYTLDEVFFLTRTFCYGIHRRRLHLLGRFNFLG